MLTLQENKAFDFIRQFISQNGYSPTVAEIAGALGIKSRGVAHRYVASLTQKGFLKSVPNRRRNLELVKKAASQNLLLPIVGRIAAGSPIEAIQQLENIDIKNTFLKEGHFALRVRGDSMIDEGILDGDIVICAPLITQVTNGQIVVALIDQQEATLKRIEFNSNKTVTLNPANKQLKPMCFPAHRVQVQGVFVGLIRLSV